MRPDIVDCEAFYASRLGHVARRIVWRAVREVWPDLNGLTVAGIGHATPYLPPFLSEAARVVAFMPAFHGVRPWPADGARLVALADDADLPLPDGALDRVLLVHGLEHGAPVRPMLREIWRALADGGRLLCVVPNRRGLWARVERTPFGAGRPFSSNQLRELLRDNLFAPGSAGAALFVPPARSTMLLRTAGAWERLGRRWGSPFAGVILLEATKQIYGARPEGAGEAVRRRIYVPAPGADAFDPWHERSTPPRRHEPTA